MTFDELKIGMKSLFSSLGAKTSDSNYAVGLFDKTSAEPKGIMDMASLASVLGVLVGDLGGSGTSAVIDSVKAYWSTMPANSFASGYMNGTLSAYVMIFKHDGFGRIEIRYRGSGSLETYNKGTQEGDWAKL